MEFIENGNIRLPLLGLGTFSMHGEQLKNSVCNALKLGYGLYDTATKYENEEDMGKVINGAEVTIQSKVHAAQLIGNWKCLRLNRKNIKTSFELSKERLGVSPSIYLLHSPFDGYERHFKNLISLREKGEVKAVGVCNVSLAQLINLENSTGMTPDIVQAEIHPYHSNKELVGYCKEHGILVEARSPFAHGDAMQEWLSNADLQEISSKYGKSVPQVILRWITQQKVTAIVRTTSIEHLKENISIFDFTLTEDEKKKIDLLNKNQSYGFISSKKQTV